MRNVHPLQGKIRIGDFTTSNTEIIHLVKSWIAISIAFTILKGGLRNNFVELMIFSAITVGIAFLLHELAHKLVAQHYGCFAEFRADDKMLLLAIGMSFVGFIFFAPGAVMIAGPVGVKRNGIISAAGPLTNFGLAIIFLLVGIYTQGISSWLTTLFSYGAMINTWIGLFNMIPFLMFDGKKILTWSKPWYIGMVAVGIILLFIV